MKNVKNLNSEGTSSVIDSQNNRNAGQGDGSAEDESRLISQSQSGNIDAFGQLVVKYQHRLFNAILRMVASYDDAQELTQEAFCRALRGIRKFRGSSGFYTWLFRIGINLSINHRRRKQQIHFASLHDNRNVMGQQAAGLAEMADLRSRSPEYQVELNEAHQRVIAALERLEPQERAIVVLRDIEEMNYDQIAAVLEIPIGTVKSRLSRARMALREIVLKNRHE
jgi:RNA polymerase sigma-70 factor, ECF subfamily